MRAREVPKDPKVVALDLAIRYAQNRKSVTELKTAISKLFREHSDDPLVSNPIDLQAHRAAWLEEDQNWRGWVVAVELAQINDPESVGPKDMDLARLLDQKAALRAEVGKIKAHLHNLGKAALAAREATA